MKNRVLLYFEMQKKLSISGIGRALSHQKKALTLRNFPYTLDPQDKEYNIVHINTLFSRSYNILKYNKKRGIPVIVHGHSTKEDFRHSFRMWRLIQPFFNLMMLRMYKNAEYIITPTNYSKKLIEGYKNVNAKVYSLSNGIDLDEYRYNQNSVDMFNKKFQLKEDDKIVIGVGLLFERKGILDFFEVAKELPDVTFIWFGHLDSILMERKIKRAIKNRPKNVIMPGFIEGNIIKGAFHRANAMFFPSYEETEGIVVLEALASKLPLVVRRIPVYQGWLEENINCRMGSENVEFIDLIKETLLDDNSNMVQQGYKVACDRSIDNISHQLVNIYQEIINNQ